MATHPRRLSPDRSFDMPSVPRTKGPTMRQAADAADGPALGSMSPARKCAGKAPSSKWPPSLPRASAACHLRGAGCGAIWSRPVGDARRLMAGGYREGPDKGIAPSKWSRCGSPSSARSPAAACAASSGNAGTMPGCSRRLRRTSAPPVNPSAIFARTPCGLRAPMSAGVESTCAGRMGSDTHSATLEGEGPRFRPTQAIAGGLVYRGREPTARSPASRAPCPPIGTLSPPPCTRHGRTN